MEWRAREGGYLGTIRDFASACGVHEVAMGRYIAGLQQPGPESQDKIANVTGVGIYEACNAPLRVPKDKQLERFLVTDWPDMTKDERKDIMDAAHDFAERRRKAMTDLTGKAAKTS